MMRAKLWILSVALLLSSFATGIGLAQTGDPAKRKKPVALIAGRAIYEDELLPLVQVQLLQLRNQEYELKSKALEDLVDQKLLESEARRRGMPVEKLLAQEVHATVAEPTDVELEAYYASQKDTLNRPFDQVKRQMRLALNQERIQQSRQEFLKGLRHRAKVTILLRPPRAKVAYDSARLRGSFNVPVIIVEFSDFQCPFCRMVQPTLKRLLAKYEGQVSLAYRDFPLREIHSQAQLAAEASRCAGEQGKFWEYHDLLFASPNKLDRQGLIEQARSLKLDEGRFDSCLASGKHKAQIEEDVQEGMMVGVSGTPGFFINGIWLSGAKPEAAFEKIIQAELAALSQNVPPNNH